MEKLLKEVKEDLNLTIDKITKVHECGEPYFDALDKYIREEAIDRMLLGNGIYKEFLF